MNSEVILSEVREREQGHLSAGYMFSIHKTTRNRPMRRLVLLPDGILFQIRLQTAV